MEAIGFKLQRLTVSEIVGLENTLKKMGYSVKDNFYQNLSSRSDIEAHLKALDKALEFV